MQVKYTPALTHFGLLPEPERRPGTFLISMMINGTILGLLLYIGATAKRAIEEHKYEMTTLIIPNTPPPPKPKLP